MSIVARLKRPGGAPKEFILPANGPLFMGRDALGIEDKKCSRKQAQLISHGDGTLGMNPIFVATKQEKKMIKQNEKVGDMFCLVANDHPVELVQVGSKKQLSVKPVIIAAAKLPSADVAPPPYNNEEDTVQPKPAVKPRRLLMEDTDEDEGLWSAAVKASKKQSQQKGEVVPAKKPPPKAPKRSTTADDEALARAIAADEEDNDMHTATKAKKLKAGASGDKQKVQRAASDAYDVYNHSSDEDFVVRDAAGKPPSPKTSVRTRNRDKLYCRYGSKCYRKNPDHLAEFYHPSPESDEEEDAPSD